MHFEKASQREVREEKVMVSDHPLVDWSQGFYGPMDKPSLLGLKHILTFINDYVDVLLIQLAVTILLYYYNHLAH
jgi:hypothetical protein